MSELELFKMSHSQLKTADLSVMILITTRYFALLLRTLHVVLITNNLSFGRDGVIVDR
jgi:hypothetical protein